MSSISLQKIINPLLMWLVVIIGAVVCAFLFSSEKIFSLGIFAWLILIICFVYWIFVLFKGLSLHQQAINSVAGVDHLVTSGIFKSSRHPLYGTHIVMAWGIALFIATPKVLAIALWLAIVLIVWAKLEELGLEQKFGQEYKNYKKITPMFIPRFWKIWLMVLVVLFMPGFLFAEDLATICQKISSEDDGCANLTAQDCKATLEKCATYYEQQAQSIANDMTKTAAEKKTLATAIANSQQKISGLETQIKQGTIKVKGLNLQINDTKNSIDKTALKIEDSQNQIKNILRVAYQENKKSSAQILLEGNLSDFFSNLTYLENLNSKVSDLLESTKNLKNYLEGQKNKMDTEVDELQKTIALQSLQKQETQQAKKEKEGYLKLTEAQYQQQLKEKQEAEKKSAAIKAKLFQMVGVTKAPTFGEALDMAKSVAGIVGIRPAFLLAIISQESAIGKNVGQCVLVDSATGTGKRISTGATVIRVMKPTRDVKPFLQITSALGRDPYDTPISCWIPVYYSGSPSGWGGAMGPAQFIPSTWNLLTERLKTLLGKPGDPWAIKDSFTASALYLSDLGASAKTTTAENKAAARYYGAAGSYNSTVMKRATCIQSFIDTGTMSTSCQGLIF